MMFKVAGLMSMFSMCIITTLITTDNDSDLSLNVLTRNVLTVKYTNNWSLGGM